MYSAFGFLLTRKANLLLDLKDEQEADGLGIDYPLRISQRIRHSIPLAVIRQLFVMFREEGLVQDRKGFAMNGFRQDVDGCCGAECVLADQVFRDDGNEFDGEIGKLIGKRLQSKSVSMSDKRRGVRPWDVVRLTPS